MSDFSLKPKPKKNQVFAPSHDLNHDLASGSDMPSTLPPKFDNFASRAINEAEGFKDIPEDKTNGNGSKTLDIADLNESTMLNYPIIARALNESPMAIIKPKDPSIVFHWVFYDRSATGNTAKIVAKNIQRYKFWGFSFATIEDIEGGEEAFGDGIVDDGGQITNYDTVLMKIDKVKLMAHYKRNLMGSLESTDGALLRAIKTAEMDLMQSGTYSKAMSTHPKAKIKFYSPIEEEEK